MPAPAELTAVLIGAQLAGTRMDIPLMFGTTAVADPDRARVVGAGMHLVIGQGFAFGYAATYAALGEANGLLGAGLGLLHGFVTVADRPAAFGESTREWRRLALDPMRW